MNVNQIGVSIVTKSSAGQKAIESLMDNEKQYGELMNRIASAVRDFIGETGTMGTKPFDVVVGENDLQKLMRQKLVETQALSKRSGGNA